MAKNFIFFCPPLRNKSYFSLQSVLLNRKVYFSDKPSNKVNLYEALGVPSNATQTEIKKAYYDLTLRHHPDRNENCEVAATKFREVTEAYEILGNYSLRKKYDKGVPVSLMRKTIRTPVDHKVKYQKFFDSRSSNYKVSDKSKDFENFDNFGKTKDDEIRANQEGHSGPSVGLQFALAVFFLSIFFAARF